MFSSNANPRRRVKLSPKGPWRCPKCLGSVAKHYLKCPICQTKFTEEDK